MMEKLGTVGMIILFAGLAGGFISASASSQASTFESVIYTVGALVALLVLCAILASTRQNR